MESLKKAFTNKFLELELVVPRQGRQERLNNNQSVCEVGAGTLATGRTALSPKSPPGWFEATPGLEAHREEEDRRWLALSDLGGSSSSSPAAAEVTVSG